MKSEVSMIILPEKKQKERREGGWRSEGGRSEGELESFDFGKGRALTTSFAAISVNVYTC